MEGRSTKDRTATADSDNLIHVSLYSKTGKEIGEVALNKEIFGAPVNQRLLNLVEKGYSANLRRGTAST